MFDGDRFWCVQCGLDFPFHKDYTDQQAVTPDGCGICWDCYDMMMEDYVAEDDVD